MMNDDEISKYFAGLTYQGQADLLNNLALHACSGCSHEEVNDIATSIAVRMDLVHWDFFAAISDVLVNRELESEAPSPSSPAPTQSPRAPRRR